MIKSSWFSDRNIATFTLVFMSVQFLYLEGWAVSTPKVIFMMLTPLLIAIKVPYISKATFWGGIFILVTVSMTLVQFASVRMSTFYYTILFLLTFNLYYNLVYIKSVFTVDDFILIVKGIIYAYAGCLLLQQALMLIGIRYFPLVNLMGANYYELFRLNSLAIEPSHAARLLTVYFYALLKVTEYKYERILVVRELYKEYKWVIIAFLYTMVGIGSGTAFVGLAILALYFMRRQYILLIVTVCFLFYMIVPYLDYEPLNRAMAVFNATLTGDTEEVVKTDHSASSRVNIILDTFKYINFTDPDTWFGKGVDASWTSSKAVVSAITDYGLISYILKLIFFFGCCFTSFFSLETLMFVLLFSLNIGNIAYGFAALMVFSTIKYFKINRR